MRRTVFLALAALSLSGCGAREILTGIATVGGVAVGAGAGAAQTAPAVPMDQDKLQIRVRLATAEADRMTEAFESGRLPSSTSPDTAHPQFCPMVIADLAQIGAMDDGGQALANGCRVKYHLGKAKSAYEDGNAAVYADQLGKADGFLAQLTATLNRYKGAAQ